MKRNEGKEIGLNMATSGRRSEQLSFLDAVEPEKGLLYTNEAQEVSAVSLLVSNACVR